MKRRKTIRAGRLVYDIAYTVPRPNASKAERKRIREVTAEQIARTNCNTAQRKLELLMASNFDETDLVITPTYRDADLPPDPEGMRRHLTRVFAQIRAYRKARGLPDLKYIYVMEGRHGDRRLHPHIILNAVGDDLELFRSLWIWGDDVQLNYIRERGRPALTAKSSSSAAEIWRSRSPPTNGWTTARASTRRPARRSLTRAAAGMKQRAAGTLNTSCHGGRAPKSYARARA